MNSSSVEKTGLKFTLSGMEEARRRCVLATNEIAQRIVPGMTEEEALPIAEEILTTHGGNRRWHRSWIRFGENTLLAYGELSKPGVVLKENDIFFIDVGPVYEGFEADVGRTYVVGSDALQKKCALDAETLYQLTRERWLKDKLSGQALYEFASKAATDLGWQLTLNEANGHRLSDFPHKLHHTGPIADLTFSPASHHWVLEIQIRHPSLPFGAFYEDLLY